MRQYMQIVEGFIGGSRPARSFGRRGVMPTPVTPRDPTDARMKAAIDDARKYHSAEEYARNNNSIFPMNTDPDDIHHNYKREQSQLVDRWNRWKEMGYIA